MVNTRNLTILEDAVSVFTWGSAIVIFTTGKIDVLVVWLGGFGKRAGNYNQARPSNIPIVVTLNTISALVALSRERYDYEKEKREKMNWLGRLSKLYLNHSAQKAVTLT